MSEGPAGWFWIDYGHKGVGRRVMHYFEEDEHYSLCDLYRRPQISGVGIDPENNPLRCKICQRKKEKVK